MTSGSTFQNSYEGTHLQPHIPRSALGPFGGPQWNFKKEEKMKRIFLLVFFVVVISVGLLVVYFLDREEKKKRQGQKK